MHVACALWIPEAVFMDWPSPDFAATAPTMKEPVLAVHANPSRFKLVRLAMMLLKIEITRSWILMQAHGFRNAKSAQRRWNRGNPLENASLEGYVQACLFEPCIPHAGSASTICVPQACIQCANGNCPSAAHVTCALGSLTVARDWKLFPSYKSMLMYCQEKHVPAWLKKEVL